MLLRWRLTMATIGVLMLVLGVLVLARPSQERYEPRRSFLMGATYWPPAVAAAGGNDTHRRLSRLMLQSGEVLQLQLPWRPGAPALGPRARALADLASRTNKRLMVSIDWLNLSRTALRGAESERWSFTEDRVRREFRREIRRLADDVRPRYLNLGVEVNYYAGIDPAGFRAFVALFHSVKENVRSAHSTTAVFVSFQYEELRGHQTFGADRDRNQPHLELVTVFDLPFLALSTYPAFLYDSPRAIPHEYFEEAQRLDLPLAISETAWHTRSSGSVEAQRRYTRWILDKAEGLCFRFLLWSAVADTLGSVPASDHEKVHGIPAWFGSLGLYGLKGQGKPSSVLWQDAAQHTPHLTGGNCQRGPS